MSQALHKRPQRMYPLVTLLMIWAYCLRPPEAVALCQRAAQHAAQAQAVPLTVMQAIAVVETARSTPEGRAGWPWTINDGTRGHWFETKRDAIAFAQALLDHGRRSFDIGCFQMNYRWHGHKFTSLDEMFDPVANALAAASYLKTLHASAQDWLHAAGAYHSFTPVHAERYRAKVSSAMAQDGTDMPPQVTVSTKALLPGGPRQPLLSRSERPSLLLIARGRLIGGEQ